MKKESLHSGLHQLSWRLWHKWVGVVFSVFILLFCVSGIVLNHRQAFSPFEVSRWWLPEAYHIKDWNQNIIKGTMIPECFCFKGVTPGEKSSGKNVVAYGQAGVWLTDIRFQSWKPLNDGLDDGIDNRKISGVVESRDGTLWCAALWDAYRYTTKTRRWEKVSLPDNTERLSDIALRGGDTIVVASRSALYEAIAPKYEFKRIQLRNPEGYKAEETLFKTVWWLHSGQLFGTVGKLVVDFIALVIIILCVTGIVFFVLHYAKRNCHRNYVMRVSLIWHNRLGASLIILTVLLSVTGMCLRPPLMVPLVLNRTAPVPGSTMDTDNAWNDKIRAVRWDDRLGLWLMSTSEGFYALNENIETATPVKVDGAPAVSPMGITVFERNPEDSAQWLIGSFAGLERWNPQTGEITEWFDDAPPPSPIPSGNGHLVTGFSGDCVCSPVVFEYSNAPCDHTGHVQKNIPDMPEVLKEQPMSLWNFALELHVGRCYEPFLGSVISVLFVFISGLLLTLILISGYIIYKRTAHKPFRM